MIATSPNTVQLGCPYGGGGWPGGLGPVVVVGALDVPLDLLAFDEPWVGARAGVGRRSANHEVDVAVAEHHAPVGDRGGGRARVLAA